MKKKIFNIINDLSLAENRIKTIKDSGHITKKV